jgi:hypothetical protein
MSITVQVPKAFSVRDENEFYAFQHLLARMNPQLRIASVTTGLHVSGGCTVFWGVVYAEGQRLTREELLAVLEEAGYDPKRNGPLDRLNLDVMLGTPAGRAKKETAARRE